MKPSEIIANQARKDGVDPMESFAVCKKLIQEGRSLLLREQDSIFLVTRIGKGAVEVIMFTADGAMNLPNVVRTVVQKLKKANARVIYGDDEDALFQQILEQIGVPIQPENTDGHTWSAQI
jgi:hypothetical protein